MNIENGNRMWVNLQILVLFIYIFEIQQMFWKKTLKGLCDIW